MYLIVKRSFDFVFALLGLLLLSPLFLVIMLLLRLTSEGEIFYFQQRIGYRNQPFAIWKFATMLRNSANMGAGTITLRNDPRVTPIGKYLRKSKLNELPQIINVIKGDLSLVGPRPLDEKGFRSYPETIQAMVYNVHPGITGIGSIIFRDEEKLISASTLPPREFYTLHIAPYKGALEQWYQSHQSFLTDFLLLFLTAWVILFPHSTLPYRIFKDLPAKPEALRI